MLTVIFAYDGPSQAVAVDIHSNKYDLLMLCVVSVGKLTKLIIFISLNDIVEHC